MLTRALLVALSSLTWCACFRPSSVASPPSTSTTSASSSGGGAGSSVGGPFSCAGDATLVVATPGLAPPPFPDAGPPVALAAWSSAATVVSIGAGAQPLLGACRALVGSGCGLCSTLTLNLPSAVAVGTYTVGQGGVTVSQEGFGGSITVSGAGPTLSGSFNLASSFGNQTFRGSFAIPAACTPVVCGDGGPG
jgi:hypothetical protein